VARALVAQGKASASREPARQASRLLRSSQDRPTRLALAIALARLEGARDAAAAASVSAKLRDAASEAARMGHVALELEARLALIEVDARGAGGSEPDSAARLERDARARGFGLIAAKAAALRRPGS
jgi:hypothetical protein